MNIIGMFYMGYYDYNGTSGLLERLEMEREDLIKYILKSDIMKRWHWFSYHFLNATSFSWSFVEALIRIESRIKGFSFSIVDRMASISGKEKYEPHYEQLLQLCSEVYIINQAVNYFQSSNVVFEYEPTCGLSKMKPELVMNFGKFSVGIEVKQPALFNHIRKRSINPYQVSTRIPILLEALKDKFDMKDITLPRDNPVKEFLLSSNKKFESFKENGNFFSILFILWDDFIYEPISSILGMPSGLFLEGSFARNSKGERYLFENVDAVFIDRHLIQIINATRERPLLYNKKHAMDYGDAGEFPFKVIIKNPIGKDIPTEVKECFQVYELDPILGGEYVPSDYIMWL